MRGLNNDNLQLAKNTASLSRRCAGNQIEFIAEKTSTHTITVSDFAKLQTGKYKIEFQCISGSCISQALLPEQECAATFDGSVFEVPHIEVSKKVFFANFKLVPGTSPFMFELITAVEKQTP